jgi:hypothetical protein
LSQLTLSPHPSAHPHPPVWARALLLASNAAPADPRLAAIAPRPTLPMNDRRLTERASRAVATFE